MGWASGVSVGNTREFRNPQIRPRKTQAIAISFTSPPHPYHSSRAASVPGSEPASPTSVTSLILPYPGRRPVSPVAVVAGCRFVAEPVAAPLPPENRPWPAQLPL